MSSKSKTAIAKRKFEQGDITVNILKIVMGPGLVAQLVGLSSGLAKVEVPSPFRAQT